MVLGGWGGDYIPPSDAGGGGPGGGGGAGSGGSDTTIGSWGVASPTSLNFFSS